MDLVVEIQKILSDEKPQKEDRPKPVYVETDKGMDVVDVKLMVNEIIQEAIEKVKDIKQLPEAEKNQVIERLESAKI